MKLLLDTHIWIWSYSEAHKLSSEVVREITNPKNDRYLSAVSIWEAILLLEKKRIRFDRDFGEWFRASNEELSLIEVPITWQVTHELRFTMLGYKDPGDRFLVATAKVYDLTLVTADERLMRVPGIRVLPNR
jgi:PIN domain nuclease of toxin-antitoxin system